MNAPVLRTKDAVPLEGDVLEPGDDLDVIVALNMFSAAPDRIRVPAGSTIAEIVAAARDGYRGPAPVRIVVSLGDQAIAEQYWHRVRPRPGAYVQVLGAPGKDGGILRNVLLLALAVGGMAISGGLLFPALSPFAASLVGAGVVLGGTLLINALFPVRPPRLEDKSRSSATYSIAGGSNQVDRYGAVPLVLGRNRYTPNLAALPHTEYVGANQFYIAAHYWGYGPLDITEIRIGETPIAKYNDVEREIDGAFNSASGGISIVPRTVIEEQLSVELTNAAGWVVRTTALNIDRLTIDINIPNGIYKITTKDGKRSDNKCFVESRYRLVGASSWQTLKNWDFTGNSAKPQQRGYTQKVARGQYEVQVRKASSDPDPNDKDKTVVENIYWTALKSYRNEPPVQFPKPLGISALRIRATGQLNGSLQSVNGIVRPRHMAFNGTIWQANRPSSNPADLYRYVLQGPGNARPVPNARIDFPRLEDFWRYCRDKGFAFNQVRDFRASVWDTLLDVCASALAAPCFRDGKWSVAWDDTTAPVVCHFTPRNSREFSWNQDNKRAPHALRVDFINEDAGFARDERIVYNDGYSAANATVFERIEFPGVTSSGLAWVLGRLHLAQAILRPCTYRLVVAREHFRATYGDRVRVNHDIMLWGLGSGRVKAVAGQTVTLDEPVLMEGSNAYQVRFQTNGGDSLLRAVTYAFGQHTQITLSGGGSVPEPGDLFMFGLVSASESVVLRVRNIRPIDEAEAELTLVDDAPNLWDAVTGSIPPFDSQITIPPDPTTLAPVNLRFEEQIVAVGDIQTFAAIFSWETLAGSVATAFQVQFRDERGDNEWRDAGEVRAPTQSFRFIELYESTFSFRVRAVFADTTVTDWTEITGQAIAGRRPPDVENLGIKALDASATLSWDPVATFGFSHYAIRFTPETDAGLVDWNTAAEMSRVQVASATVPVLTGTYLVKAVNIVGAESETAAALTSFLGDINNLNVVMLYRGEPDWIGVLDGLQVDDSDSLRLIGQPGVLDWGPVLDIPGTYWSSALKTPIGTFTPPPIDLGEVSTSRLVPSIGPVSLEDGVESPDWSVRWLARFTDDDPLADPDWSEFAPIAVGDYSFRAVELRLVIESLALGVHPVVHAAGVEIDMPDQLRSATGIEILAPGMFVPFVPPFRLFGDVAVADATPGGRVIVSNANTDGFQVTAVDGAGDFVDGVKFSYVARGAGARKSAAGAGALYGWGLGTFGRLGNGSAAPTIVPVPTFIHAGPWLKVAAGFQHSAAIRADGTLWTWGRNNHGQLGLGDTVDRVVPTKASDDIFVAVSCGDNHTAAIRDDGKLFMVGQNDAGWLGLGDTTPRNVLTQVGSDDWIMVDARAYNTFAIRADGKAFGCGLNSPLVGGGGIIGDGSTTDRHSFVQIGDGSMSSWTWLDVTSAEFNAAAGVRSDGTLWIWGSGFGVLVPNQVGSVTTWRKVSAGERFFHFIRDNGDLRALGENGEGQLGNGDAPNDQNGTVVLIDDGPWEMTDGAPPGAGNWTVGLKGDGTLWTWGRNADGQLGDGNAPDFAEVPVRISAQHWLDAAAGNQHGLAILDEPP